MRRRGHDGANPTPATAASLADPASCQAHPTVMLLVFFLLITMVTALQTIQCPSVCSCRRTNLSLDIFCADYNLTEVPPSLPGGISSLNLSGNNINVINSSSFPHFHELHTLDLSHNNLHRIDTHSFRNVKLLRSLYLHHNKLTNISVPVFSDIVYLANLDLSQNLLTGVPVEIAQNIHLSMLDLHANLISTIPRHAFSGLIDLRVLNIAQNPITSLSKYLLYNLVSLESLNMSNTQTKEIDCVMLRDTDKLRILDLSYNLLTCLREACVHHLYSLQSLNLSRNPIICDCEMRPFREWLAKRGAALWSSYDAPTCRSPRDVTDMIIADVPVGDFQCLSTVHARTSRPRTPESAYKSNKGPIPYDPMLGWYTAAMLSGMLGLFLVCIILDKIKRTFYKWRRDLRERKRAALEAAANEIDDHLSYAAKMSHENHDSSGPHCTELYNHCERSEKINLSFTELGPQDIIIAVCDHSDQANGMTCPCCAERQRLAHDETAF